MPSLCCPGAMLWGSMGSAQPPVGRDLQQSNGWWRVWSCSSPRHGCFAVVGVPARQQSLEVLPHAAEKCSASPAPCYRGHGLRHATALPAGHLWWGRHRTLAKGEAASAAPKCSQMLSPGTFFLDLPWGMNFQASRTACRYIYCLQKRTEICDKRGVAVERQKGLGKRPGPLLSRSIRCSRCLPPGLPCVDAAATA